MLRQLVTGFSNNQYTFISLVICVSFIGPKLSYLLLLTSVKQGFYYWQPFGDENAVSPRPRMIAHGAPAYSCYAGCQKWTLPV